jgi:hypothetical protein
MAAVKVTPPNDFPLGLIRSHMVVIHLFLMLCDLQRVVRDMPHPVEIAKARVGAQCYKGKKTITKQEFNA